MKTKTGLHIKIDRIEDSEGDLNRGWQVDKLVASVNGVEAGYLKLAYIPKSRFDEHYSAGALSFASLIEGHCLFGSPTNRIGDRKNHAVESFNEQKLRSFVNQASWIMLHKDYSCQDYRELNAMSRDELLASVQEIAARVHERFGEKFKAFRRHHINKPVVDFIWVKDAMQRQGIASALYIEGASWMASKRMRLYASSLQQPAATAAWLRMKEADWVSFDGKRPYLNVAKIAMKIDNHRKLALHSAP